MGVKLFTLNSADEFTSTRVALRLTRARRHAVVRLTGGFGNMDERDGKKGVQLIAKALRGFEGTLMFGGTRVVSADDPTHIVPTLGEVAPLVMRSSPNAEFLGIAPRVDIAELEIGLGLIISRSDELRQLTIIHPEIENCMLVQVNSDEAASWDAEWRASMVLTQLLIETSWQPLLIAYNGGGVTRREIEAWVANKWPVLLIEGSGRVTDELINTPGWLESHPSVVTTQANVAQIRAALAKLGVM